MKALLIAMLICATAHAEDAGALMILPGPGDSLTQGGYGSSPVGAWRAPLYRKLVAAGVKFHFIGTEKSTDPPEEPRHMGRGGATTMFWSNSFDYNAGIGPFPQWLMQNHPDVATPLLGTNDMAINWYQSAPESLARVIRILLQINSAMKVVVVAIPTTIAGQTSRKAVEFNGALPGVATYFQKKGFDVSVVDPACGASELVDGTHPGPACNEKIAQALFCQIIQTRTRKAAFSRPIAPCRP